MLHHACKSKLRQTLDYQNRNVLQLSSGIEFKQNVEILLQSYANIMICCLSVCRCRLSVTRVYCDLTIGDRIT